MQNFFWFIGKAKKPADKSELEIRSKKDNDEKLALCRFMRIISNASGKYQVFLNIVQRTSASTHRILSCQGSM
ncbi:MAG: hypothetical protein ACOH2K_17815 [Burkholderiaceae bacterium]